MKKSISFFLAISIMLTLIYTVPIYADGVDSAIQARIDELYNLIGNTYFTTDQKSAGSSSDRCLNSNVIKADWFKQKFGISNLSVSQFPGSPRCTAEAWSCSGFASFAGWYIFRNSNTDNIRINELSKMNYTYANVTANAKIGDIVSLSGTKYNTSGVATGTAGHEFIFISADSNGAYVLDSNWGNDCKVTKHYIRYSYCDYFQIGRATNRESIELPETEVPTYPGEPIKYVVCNTNDASNVTATSAIFNGRFTNPAGAKIIKRGYQWGATPEMCNYTVFDCDITWADGLTHNMMGLSPNTTYYYKLVVQDENGKYIYGNTKSFKTLSSGIEKVICNTGDAYNITATSAVLNGTFTNPSGALIVKRGFQWGATPEMCNFTVFDCNITWVDGLNHNMVNLVPNTTYYYKLIVKGENGDYIYGNAKSFTTLSVPDTDNPIITNLKPRYISGKSFTLKCNLYDNIDVKRVWLVIYSPNGEHQFGVKASNGNFSYTINTSDYGGSGYYSVRMYAFDANENSSSVATTGRFLVADDTVPPELTNLSVSNVGDKVFEINCNLWDNIDVTRLWMVVYCPKGEYQFEIPTKQGDFTYPIDTDSYGGLGEYVIHIYAFDDAENSSGMVSTGLIVPQYYIGYDANGGSEVPNTQVKKYGESLKIDSKQPIRTGYVFKGWSDVITSASPTFYPGTIFNNNCDLMLYACWEPAKYTITFESNSSEIQTTNKTVVYDSEYGTMPELHKDGYVFLGWFTEQTNGELVTSDTKVLITKNQTLYAHWVIADVYTKSMVKKTGTVLKVDTEAHNFSTPYMILVAGYKGNRCVAIETISHEVQSIACTLVGDIDRIKVMTWSGMEGQHPLCKAEEIPSSKFIIE